MLMIILAPQHTKIAFSALIFDADNDTIDETVDILISSVMPNDDLSQIEFRIKNRKTTVDATGE